MLFTAELDTQSENDLEMVKGLRRCSFVQWYPQSHSTEHHYLFAIRYELWMEFWMTFTIVRPNCETNVPAFMPGNQYTKCEIKIGK